MRTDVDRYFHVFKAGRLTVVGFTATEVLSLDNVESCRRKLQQLVDEHACQELVVDLYDMPVVSSWILGLLAYIRTRGVLVHLYHPSPAVRDVLQISHLDRLMDVRGEIRQPA